VIGVVRDLGEGVIVDDLNEAVMEKSPVDPFQILTSTKSTSKSTLEAVIVQSWVSCNDKRKSSFDESSSQK